MKKETKKRRDQIVNELDPDIRRCELCGNYDKIYFQVISTNQQMCSKCNDEFSKANQFIHIWIKTKGLEWDQQHGKVKVPQWKM